MKNKEILVSIVEEKLQNKKLKTFNLPSVVKKGRSYDFRYSNIDNSFSVLVIEKGQYHYIEEIYLPASNPYTAREIIFSYNLFIEGIS